MTSETEGVGYGEEKKIITEERGLESIKSKVRKVFKVREEGNIITKLPMTNEAENIRH